MTIITVSKYNAHTEPLFKSLDLLRVSDLFKLFQSKFYYKFLHKLLPSYFQMFPLLQRGQISRYTYVTRNRDALSTNRVKHEFAKHCLRHSIPRLINSIPDIIKHKLYTHSLSGFSTYFKRYQISR